jgi:hypothetical protein
MYEDVTPHVRDGSTSSSYDMNVSSSSYDMNVSSSLCQRRVNVHSSSSTPATETRTNSLQTYPFPIL